MARKGGNPSIYAKPLQDKPMAEAPLSVRLPVELAEYVRSLPNRTEWLREAIAEKRQREEANLLAAPPDCSTLAVIDDQARIKGTV